MKIIYTDGSVLQCSEIRVEGNVLIADDIYIVPIDEITGIEEA